LIIILWIIVDGSLWKAIPFFNSQHISTKILDETFNVGELSFITYLNGITYGKRNEIAYLQIGIQLL
jgi:hypothetical protein